RHTRFSRDWSSDVCSSDLGVEGAHGQLGAGLAYGLGGDDAYGGPHVHQPAYGQIAAVAAGAHAVAGAAGEDRADVHLLEAGLHEALGDFLGDLLVLADDDLAGFGVAVILAGHPADDPVGQGLDDLAAVADLLHGDAGG